MIEDLLLYSKLDLNQMHFETVETNIVKYINDLIDGNSGDFERKTRK